MPGPGQRSTANSAADEIARQLAGTAGAAAGGGSRTGTGTGTGTNPNQNGLTPLTGFASQYSPEQATQAYDNPWYILQDVFKGINPSSPGFQGLRDFGGDPLTLFNVMSGADRRIEDSGANEFINFMANLYKNLGTVGGQTFSSQELLGNIFGTGVSDTDPGTGEARTTLGQILQAGDQSTQVRTLFNLLRDVSNVTMNPLAASAYQAATARAGDTYGNAMMQRNAGDIVGPAQWMSQNTPWLTQR